MNASPERWSAIQNDGFFRDSKGQAQRPMIIFIRTSVTKDDNFSPINNQPRMMIIFVCNNVNFFCKLNRVRKRIEFVAFVQGIFFIYRSYLPVR